MLLVIRTNCRKAHAVHLAAISGVVCSGAYNSSSQSTLFAALGCLPRNTFTMSDVSSFKSSLRQKISGFIENRPQMFGAICSVLATLVWSGNFIAGRVLRVSSSPAILVFWRCVLATLILLPFALPHLKKAWPAVCANLKFLVIISILGITIPNIFIYAAARYSQTLNLSILSLTVPLFVIIMARIFFNEYLSLLRVFGLFITIAGILLLLSMGDINILMNLHFEKGDLLIFCNTIPFAIYTLFMRKMPKGINGATFMFIFIAFGGIFVIPAAIWEACTDGYIIVSAELVFGLVYVSLGASVLGYAFWNMAVRYIGAAKTSIIYYLMPVFCGIEGLLLLDEQISLTQVFSMILIVAGTFLAINANKTGNK
jgi:drug/metabolite transporter (DMT)-like permease